jgi:ribosomal protein L7/L12
MVEDVIANVGRLPATRQEESTSGEAIVLDILRGNPLANRKVVRELTGLSESNAKRALTAARKELSRQTTALPARPGHANARSPA